MKPRASTRPPRMKYPESAAWCRKIRESAGLSQDDFAVEADIPVASVRDYEQGVSRPGYENHQKLKAMEENMAKRATGVAKTAKTKKQQMKNQLRMKGINKK